MTSKRSKIKGMSLVEVIVAAGIGAAITFAMTSLMGNLQVGVKRAQDIASTMQLQSFLETDMNATRFNDTPVITAIIESNNRLKDCLQSITPAVDCPPAGEWQPALIPTKAFTSVPGNTVVGSVTDQVAGIYKSDGSRCDDSSGPVNFPDKSDFDGATIAGLKDVFQDWDTFINLRCTTVILTYWRRDASSCAAGVVPALNNVDPSVTFSQAGVPVDVNCGLQYNYIFQRYVPESKDRQKFGAGGK